MIGDRAPTLQDQQHFLIGTPMVPANTLAHLIQRLRNCNHLVQATSIQAVVVKHGFLVSTVTNNHLINSYVRLREVALACRVFDEMSQPNVVSWSSLMTGYIDAGRPGVALGLYTRMWGSSVAPNVFTLSAAINGCSLLADYATGRRIHAHVEILGFRTDLVVCSSLVDMYGKCNDIDCSRRIFGTMSYRNVVAWTSIIAAYAQNGRGNEALQAFREFSCSIDKTRPNHFMLASVINACACLGKLVAGKTAHGAVVRLEYDSNGVVASALVDMYAKCGSFEYSDTTFRRISDPGVFAYTSMIMGAAKYGLGKLSLELFNEMINRRIKPNDITLLGLLHACSHAGLVDEGLWHLNSMYENYEIIPDAKHYSCVVDMLGRVGRLDEALRLAKFIRADPDQRALIWGTLLSASKLQGRIDIASEASKQLMESNQQSAGTYIALSNAYVQVGEWERAQSLRDEMKGSGIWKIPACSWIEITDSTYIFYAGNLLFESSDKVLALLRDLEKRMKDKGYVGRREGLVFVDVEAEARDEIVALHSERLALAFGLIRSPANATIRIMKNLRMCRDCHDVFKLLSEILERDIVVRDVNRFHHFRNGSCTCRDFW